LNAISYIIRAKVVDSKLIPRFLSLLILLFSCGFVGCMDKFGGEGFRAWKFKMAFLLRKDESWSLVNGDESMPWIPTIRVQKRKRLEIMVLHNQLEDFYLTNEPLQQINECKTSK
jgi:hypothetical protein